MRHQRSKEALAGERRRRSARPVRAAVATTPISRAVRAARPPAPARHTQPIDFAGFLARREERPILDEEDRFAVRNLVRIYPQWDGSATDRWTVGPGWGLRLSRNEEVRWVLPRQA